MKNRILNITMRLGKIFIMFPLIIFLVLIAVLSQFPYWVITGGDIVKSYGFGKIAGVIDFFDRYFNHEKTS